jgi:hypothetical protein
LSDIRPKIHYRPLQLHHTTGCKGATGVIKFPAVGEKSKNKVYIIETLTTGVHPSSLNCLGWSVALLAQLGQLLSLRIEDQPMHHAMIK